MDKLIEKINDYLNEDKIGMKAGVVPFYIENNNIKIMLVIPSNPAYGGTHYQISKGRQDGNEKPIETAKREAFEEMGLDKSNVSDFFFCAKEKIQGMTRSYNLHIFAAEIKNPLKFSKSDFEIKTKNWIDADNIMIIRRTQQSLIKKVIKQIKKRKNIKF